jgi:hypothetical protein
MRGFREGDPVEKGIECPESQPRDYRWLVVAVVQGLLRGVGYSVIVSVESRWHLLDQVIGAIQSWLGLS